MTMRPAALFAPLLLAGCVTGTDYVRPPVQIAPRYRAAFPGRVTTMESWWRSFDDPVLQTLVAAVLDQNLDIDAAIARVERARAAVHYATAALRPSGTINATASRSRESTEVGLASLADQVPGIEYNRTQSAFDSGLNASWELDLFGGLHRDREARSEEYQAAVASGAAVRVTVVAEAADAYLQLRTLQLRMAIVQDQSRSTARLEQLVRQRYEAGESSLRELEQARASDAQVRASLPALRGEIEGQLNRLAVLTGNQPESDRAGLEAPRPVPLPLLADLGTPGDLLRKRPDIVAAERRLAAAHARIGVALAEYYPKVSLSALAGFQASSASRLFTGPASVLQGGVGLRWRLFDFERIQAEVADARGAEREALAGYRQSVLRAAEDVENAVALYSAGRDRMAAHDAEGQAAQRARDLLDQAWKAGQIGLSEVIEADRRVLQARDAAAIARGDTARAAVATYRALGG